MTSSLRATLRATLYATLLGAAAAANAATVEVHVSGVAAGKGKINVAVCDQAHFLKQCAYSGSAPAKDAEATITINGVPPGAWAVSAYQDENENDKLDTNFIGIPKENYGFSRDARSKFGPPSFEDAALDVRDNAGGPTVVAVRLR